MPPPSRLIHRARSSCAPTAAAEPASVWASNAIASPSPVSSAACSAAVRTLGLVDEHHGELAEDVLTARGSQTLQAGDDVQVQRRGDRVRDLRLDEGAGDIGEPAGEQGGDPLAVSGLCRQSSMPAARQRSRPASVAVGGHPDHRHRRRLSDLRRRGVPVHDRQPAPHEDQVDVPTARRTDRGLAVADEVHRTPELLEHREPPPGPRGCPRRAGCGAGGQACEASRRARSRFTTRASARAQLLVVHFDLLEVGSVQGEIAPRRAAFQPLAGGRQATGAQLAGRCSFSVSAWRPHRIAVAGVQQVAERDRRRLGVGHELLHDGGDRSPFPSSPELLEDHRVEGRAVGRRLGRPRVQRPREQREQRVLADGLDQVAVHARRQAALADPRGARRRSAR